MGACGQEVGTAARVALAALLTVIAKEMQIVELALNDGCVGAAGARVG
jgi:hypothetical protein